jgi:hypothetical protein
MIIMILFRFLVYFIYLGLGDTLLTRWPNFHWLMMIVCKVVLRVRQHHLFHFRGDLWKIIDNCVYPLGLLIFPKIVELWRSIEFLELGRLLNIDLIFVHEGELLAKDLWFLAGGSGSIISHWGIIIFAVWDIAQLFRDAKVDEDSIGLRRHILFTQLDELHKVIIVRRLVNH